MIELDEIKQLVTQGDAHTLTIYVTVDPAARENQAAHPAWRVWLKNALNDIEAGIDRAQDTFWPEIRAQAEAYFAEYQPSSKSLALLVGPDLQQAYELAVAVENEAFYGKPMVVPLLWVMEEYQPYLLVLVDHEKARFYTASLGELGFQDAMTLELDTEDWVEKSAQRTASSEAGHFTRGTGSTGFGRGNKRDEFEQRVDEHHHRFYREIAARIEHISRDRDIQRLVLGGNEHSAHAVRDLLHESVAELVVDVQSIPMYFTTQEIIERVQPAALDYERQQEMDLVEQVINLAKSGGRGALGRVDVMQALDQQRVEVLVAPWRLDDPELEAELPARVFASSGTIELVHGEAAERLKAEGGLAARLYYAL
jgi:hypothetical protein